MRDFATCTNEEPNVVPVAMLMADIRKIRIDQNKCVGCRKCIKICHKHAPVYVPQNGIPEINGHKSLASIM